MGYGIMTDIIKVNDLTKKFNGIEVLKGVNLTIRQGEFLCIIGPSGGGKTTLLNLVGGFLPRDQGVVLLENKEITRPVKDCIMVFQEFNQLFPWKTLKENIAFPLRHSKKKYAKEEIEAKSLSMLEMVKLKDFQNFYPYQLSGGMKQRGAIARALVTYPKVLLMDEPFGSLDVQTKDELHETLIRLWVKTKTTILFVTHDVREALSLGDRIAIVKNGGISQVIDNHEKSVTEEKVKELTNGLLP